MNLLFGCTSDRQVDAHLAREICDDFFQRANDIAEQIVARTWNDMQCNPVDETAATDQQFSVTVQFELDLDTTESHGNVLSSLHKVMSVLCELSSRHSLKWSVGHQMEQTIGKIENGQLSSDLCNELEMSLWVAMSLQAIPQSEEDIDSDAIEDDSLVHQLRDTDENDWASLLDDEDSFQRFPEWE